MAKQRFAGGRGGEVRSMGGKSRWERLSSRFPELAVMKKSRERNAARRKTAGGTGG